jgi:3-isopropylmalate/(R)-2-methylmalate dehydratase large subunit
MGHTFVEKVLGQRVNRELKPGEIVEVEPDLCMSHDNAGLVIRQFREIGVSRTWNPTKIVIPLDHRAPAESVKTANAHRSIRQFVQEQGIEHFYEIGEGICHQVVVERAFVLPGEIALGTDSHTTSYGCLGAFSTGIGATEMAAVWATGSLWLRVPETIVITITGAMPPGVYAKDVILYTIGDMTASGANYQSVEFTGDTVEAMSISERFTLTNLTMEMGAKCAVVPADRKTADYLADRATREYHPVVPDADATYRDERVYDVSQIEPQVACPHAVDNVKPVSAVAGLEIDQAFVGSCTNGRLDDLAIAAQILKDRGIHPRVRMIVGPASREIYLAAMDRGYLTTFLKAGCTIINPGCGPCLGAHQGILADGERCIATTNRNFKGRMGSTQAEVYLASPAVVAASAIAGAIALPEEVVRP